MRPFNTKLSFNTEILLNSSYSFYHSKKKYSNINTIFNESFKKKKDFFQITSELLYKIL
jgi:hypothetical protein